MADFLSAFNHTSSAEGGYVNNKNDKGGETYRGISRRNWPDWPGWAVIDNLKIHITNSQPLQKLLEQQMSLQAMVRDFYKKYFWDNMKLDSINSQQIATEMYDTGVNMGIATAVRFAQTAYNLLSKNGEVYSRIQIDGQIGSVTVNSLNNHRYPERLVKVMNILQGSKYIQLCLDDPTQEEFLSGWITRVQ